jgi:energy-coupling factor transporter transmembrane protein EcfT
MKEFKKMLAANVNKPSFWVQLASLLIVLFVLVAKYGFHVIFNQQDVIVIGLLLSSILGFVGSFTGNKALTEASKSVDTTNIEKKIDEIGLVVDKLIEPKDSKANSLGIVLDKDGNIIGTDTPNKED